MDAITAIFDIKNLERAARWVCAVLFASVVGGAFWMAIIEEGHGGHILGTTWTSHDFPDGLGNALGAQALEPARRGMWGTLVLATLTVLLFAAIERFLPGKRWHKGLSFAPIPFLLWGLVFCPLVNAKQILPADGNYVYLPSGLFGTASSLGTIASGAVAAIGASLVIARIYQLVRTEHWWERASTNAEFIVDHSVGPLLELPEQGAEQRGKGTGGQTDPLRWT